MICGTMRHGIGKADICESVGVGSAHASFSDGSDTGKRMFEVGAALLAALSPYQRSKTLLPAASEERTHWDYRPGQRIGLPLKEMESSQQKRALSLLASGMSRDGYRKALAIMSHEKLLGEVEGATGYHVRDPDLYFVVFFGEPSLESPWAWRMEGHHVSVNFFVMNTGEIAPTPNFLGANPARVFNGPLAGLRILAAEEDLARGLVNSFEGNLRARALVDTEAPADIITEWKPRVKPDLPIGLPLAEMTADQRESLMNLVWLYVTRLPEDVADVQMNRIEKEGRGLIHFAWAGSTAPGEPHYYRMHGPRFLVEYDNTQNHANHIHTVWRDLTNDWGDDLLETHYARSHVTN
ncbi:MAG: DUF3500 domain-containing protein [Deltaproteobacteria bacterium]|nr:DUF3500 domain-containing protein [Deltaproteobacteria bacterium]